jgi:phospholipase/carboxylesterase
MAEAAEITTLEINGWTLQFRPGKGAGSDGGKSPLVLMIHGWTGDENVMWIFAQRVPDKAMLIAPRGLYPARNGGFAWQPEFTSRWSDFRDLIPAADRMIKLLDQLEGLSDFRSVDFRQLHLMGFSQGAALVYTLALAYPERVRSLVGLAGFIPGEVISIIQEHPLLDKPVFVAHGSQDEIVPVERARQAVSLLEQAGAKVTYCEDEVGHKLGARCFRAMQTFLRQQIK